MEDIGSLNSAVLNCLANYVTDTNPAVLESVSKHLDPHGRCLMLLALSTACRKGAIPLLADSSCQSLRTADRSKRVCCVISKQATRIEQELLQCKASAMPAELLSFNLLSCLT